MFPLYKTWWCLFLRLPLSCGNVEQKGGVVPAEKLFFFCTNRGEKMTPHNPSFLPILGSHLTRNKKAGALVCGDALRLSHVQDPCPKSSCLLGSLKTPPHSLRRKRAISPCEQLGVPLWPTGCVKSEIFLTCPVNQRQKVITFGDLHSKWNKNLHLLKPPGKQINICPVVNRFPLKPARKSKKKSSFQQTDEKRNQVRSFFRSIRFGARELPENRWSRPARLCQSPPGGKEGTGSPGPCNSKTPTAKGSSCWLPVDANPKRAHVQKHVPTGFRLVEPYLFWVLQI